jgi:hypothetical protein
LKYVVLLAIFLAFMLFTFAPFNWQKKGATDVTCKAPEKAAVVAERPRDYVSE